MPYEGKVYLNVMNSECYDQDDARYRVLPICNIHISVFYSYISSAVQLM
jgi:hypothetical protein